MGVADNYLDGLGGGVIDPDFRYERADCSITLKFSDKLTRALLDHLSIE